MERYRAVFPTKTSAAVLERTPVSNKVIEEEGLRQGRTDSHFRPIFMKPGVVSQASGSAYIEIGKTKVVCAV